MGVKAVLFALAFSGALCTIVHGQPGRPFGRLTVNVVTVDGNPIREAYVANAIIRTSEERVHRTIESSGVLIGRRPVFDEGSGFNARDGKMSSFVGEALCGDSYAILVSAPGYKSVLKKDRMEKCPMELSVMLEPNGESLPSYGQLITVSGRLRGHGGLELDGALRFTLGQRTFIPMVDTDGAFSAEFPPGLYNIEFQHHQCSQHLITGYKIGSTARNLELDVNCTPPN